MDSHKSNSIVSTMCIEPVNSIEYQQRLLECLTPDQKQKILQFFQASSILVNDLEEHDDLCALLLAELNEIGPFQTKKDYLNIIQVWKDFVITNGDILIAEDKQLQQIIVQENEQWLELSEDQLDYVSRQLTATSNSKNVWTKITTNLNKVCYTRKCVAYWKDCLNRLVKQLDSRKELILYLESKYGTTPPLSSLTEVETNLIRALNPPEDINAGSWASHCRICLQPKNLNMLHLFDRRLTKSVEKSLLEKLIFCSYLKSEPQLNDDLPQYVCYRCSVLIENAYELKILCAKSEEKFQQSLIQKTEIEAVVFKSEDFGEISQNEEVILMETEDATFLDQYVEDKKKEERSHEKKSDERSRIGTKMDPQKQQEANQSNSKNEDHLCYQCGRILKSARNLSHHLITHRVDRPHSCKICSKKFRTKSALHNHRAVHLDTKDFQCSVCSFSTNTLSNLRVHERKHNDAQNYPCKYCEMKFKTASNVLKHMRNVHQKQREFKCNHCNSAYFSREGLRRHNIIHTGQRPFYCPIKECAITYLWYSGLRKHVGLQHNNIDVPIPTETAYLDEFDKTYKAIENENKN